MGTYELFAWQDAMSIAIWMDEEFGATAARKVFEGIARPIVTDFERKYQDLIADYIQKTEGQRPAFLKRITKQADDSTRILFATLALIGVLRAMAVMEVRDNFRTVLAPGRGNRITTASVYVFAGELRDVFEYEWPSAVFEALGVDDDEED
jgi:hypothetical protein